MRYVPFDRKLAPNGWLYIGVFVAIALLYGLNHVPASLQGANAGDACYTAQRFVRQELTAPNGATFAPCQAPDTTIEQRGAQWFVSSWVDAPNHFGATLRHHYNATLSYSEQSDTWRLLDLTITAR